MQNVLQRSGSSQIEMDKLFSLLFTLMFNRHRIFMLVQSSLPVEMFKGALDDVCRCVKIKNCHVGKLADSKAAEFVQQIIFQLVFVQYFENFP